MGWKLGRSTALYSLLAGTLSSLAWKIWQPCELDALLVGLGCALLVTVASEIAGRRSR
jgi:hypothetical protein